ncbi:MAG TPA: flagellar basal-body rod protein FlgG [Alphaproteobacteria bacterium]|nr:flagellar basal-body rod protein FlgG [Alphaproteobacteria bacterium]
MRALNIAATGMLSQQTNVEVISNNIANLNTTAFKRQRAEFRDLLYQNARRVGATSSDAGTIVPSGIQLGSGVRTAATYRIQEQGTITVTDNTLDLAVNGKGYFVVNVPGRAEPTYTRAGSFQLDATGTIVTADGYPIAGPDAVPQNAVDITVNANGQVFVKVDGQAEPVPAGQIQLVNFQNESGLQAIGDNMYERTPASGEAIEGNPGAEGFGRIIQGAVESSNVNVVAEITNLITAQRAYEMNSKVISTTDQMLNTVNQLR